MRTCENCRGDFEPGPPQHAHSQRYCTASCRKAAAKRRAVARRRGMTVAPGDNSQLPATRTWWERPVNKPPARQLSKPERRDRAEKGREHSRRYRERQRAKEQAA